MNDDLLSSENNEANEEISLYLQELATMPVLSVKEEQQVVQQMTEAPHSAEAQVARKLLIEANLRMVVRVARRYQSFGVGLADLVQEGNMELVEAAHSFDPQRHQRFRPFATRCVNRALQRVVQKHLCERNLVVAKSMPARPLSIQVLKALAHHLLDEASSLDGLPENSLLSLEALAEDENATDGIYDDHTSSRQYTSEEDNEASPEEVVCQKDLSCSLANCLQSLTWQERAVLTYRYLLGASLTLEVVGRMLGVSRERVRQVEKQGLRKLRQPCHRSVLRSLL